jgi:hypothetical protein
MIVHRSDKSAAIRALPLPELREDAPVCVTNNT